MAKLKAHGRELDRREYPYYRVAVMADGHILRDSGTGWKIWKRVKPGIDPQAYARDARADYEARPASFHAYMRVLKRATELRYRPFLHEAVVAMGMDADGVYSQFNDYWYGHEVEMEDCIELCGLWDEVLGDYRSLQRAQAEEKEGEAA